MKSELSTLSQITKGTLRDAFSFIIYQRRPRDYLRDLIVSQSHNAKVSLLRILFFYFYCAFESKNFQRSIKIKNPAKAGLLHLSAERTLQSSNLRPLNELENSRLKKAISPYKIEPKKEEPIIDVLLRDLTAINDFLFYIESEPFITPEKAKNIKRVPFKKVMAA